MSEPLSGNTPAIDSEADDVVALMARIQAGATAGRLLMDGRLAPLRATLQPLLSLPRVAASAAEVQREANLLLQDLVRALDASGQKTRLLPGRLAFLKKAAHMDLHVAVSARLVGSLNTMLQSLERLESALEAWDRQETAWRAGVVAALEDLLGVPPESREPGRARRLPPAIATAADLVALRGWAEQQDRGTLDHVTALAIRVSQAEEEATSARSEADELRRRLEQLEARMEQIASRPASAGAGPVPSAPAQAPAPTPPPPSSATPPAENNAVAIGGPDFDFLVWEDLTRGDETAISEEQKKYLDWFRGQSAPVLDAGCGRGEFLQLLQTASIAAYGIDADPSMVAHCRAKGLQVEQAELFDHLRALPDSSLGGLFLGQVVEHIPPPQLRTLTDLAFARLQPGGALVMETINPTCLTTFSGAFYADPTHQKPVHPKALEYFLTASGFGPTEIILSAPIPPDEKLTPVREEMPLDPATKALVLQINGNFERLNSVLYGYANYAAAARKPVK